MDTAPVFLLVEPYPTLGLIMKNWLQTRFQNARVLIAENGMQALELTASTAPTHVLCDIDLPDQMGFEILQQLHQSLPEAKIIATGWYNSGSLLEKINSIGVNGYIVRDKLPSGLLQLWEILTE
jgi:DNA-binding NarL/FixJ family response regulator